MRHTKDFDSGFGDLFEKQQKAGSESEEDGSIDAEEDRHEEHRPVESHLNLDGRRERRRRLLKKEKERRKSGKE